jgi:hypothetical protein
MKSGYFCDTFPTQIDLKQGDASSPFVLYIFIEKNIYCNTQNYNFVCFLHGCGTSSHMEEITQTDDVRKHDAEGKFVRNGTEVTGG